MQYSRQGGRQRKREEEEWARNIAETVRIKQHQWQQQQQQQTHRESNSLALSSRWLILTLELSGSSNRRHSTPLHSTPSLSPLLSTLTTSIPSTHYSHAHFTPLTHLVHMPCYCTSHRLPPSSPHHSLLFQHLHLDFPAFITPNLLQPPLHAHRPADHHHTQPSNTPQRIQPTRHRRPHCSIHSSAAAWNCRCRDWRCEWRGAACGSVAFDRCVVQCWRRFELDGRNEVLHSR